MTGILSSLASSACEGSNTDIPDLISTLTPNWVAVRELRLSCHNWREIYIYIVISMVFPIE